MKPLLVQQDPQLAKEIDQRFAEVEEALRPYRRGDGFVLYNELSEQDKRGSHNRSTRWRNPSRRSLRSSPVRGKTGR